jgi:VWFA-related protein
MGVEADAVQSEMFQIQAIFDKSEQSSKALEQRLAIIYTLQGMQQIAQSLSGFPGRKSLIWASGGFPFSVTNSMELVTRGRSSLANMPDSLADVLPMYKRTWQLLNDAEVALYPVDIGGLRTISPEIYKTTTGQNGPTRNSSAPTSATNNQSSNNTTFRSTSTNVGPNLGSSNAVNTGNEQSMRQMDIRATFLTFAAMTGGRAYYNRNDLANGFHAAVDDSSSYYVLSYYLDRSDMRPGWQQLKVEVKRRHVEVRSRSGFFITETATDADRDRNRDLDISTALKSPLDFRSLPVVVRWYKIESSKDPGKKHVVYEIYLPPSTSIINEADSNHVVVDFVASAQTAQGQPVDHPVDQKVDAHLTAEGLEEVHRKGVASRGALELSPGEYTVRFVVRDDLSGRTGSVSAPLKIE